MKYGQKKDANHREMLAELDRLDICYIDMSVIGGGCPDVLIAVDGKWQLVEIKNPNTGYGRRGLNKNQKRWAEDWKGGPVYVIDSVEKMTRFVSGDTEGIYAYGGHNKEGVAQ